MKTTIMTLFFLSSVCFFTLLGIFGCTTSSSKNTNELQDTTTIEYWKQEANKWFSIAEENRLHAEASAKEALEIMTYGQRREMEANKNREVADSNAKVAFYNEKEAVRQKNLASEYKSKIVELEKVIEEQKKTIEELKKKIKN